MKWWEKKKGILDNKAPFPSSSIWKLLFFGGFLGAGNSCFSPTHRRAQGEMGGAGGEKKIAPDAQLSSMEEAFYLVFRLDTRGFL